MSAGQLFLVSESTFNKVKDGIGDLKKQVFLLKERTNELEYQLTEKMKENKMPETKEEESVSASEVLYGFVAWLTTRKSSVHLGSTFDSAPIAELLGEYCKANGFDDPGDDWANQLVHPEESTVSNEGYSGPVFDNLKQGHQNRVPVEENVYASEEVFFMAKRNDEYINALKGTGMDSTIAKRIVQICRCMISEGKVE